MKLSEGQNKLEMALMSHQKFIFEDGDWVVELIWSDEVDNYRAVSMATGLDLGVLKIELLLKFVNDERVKTEEEFYEKKGRIL